MTALVTVAGVPFDQAVALVLIGAIVGATVAAVLVFRAWQRDVERRVFGPRPTRPHQGP